MRGDPRRKRTSISYKSDEILHLNLGGARLPVEEVAADGLDRDYSGRLGPLRALVAAGDPVERLEACYLLLAWGDPAGYDELVVWCASPEPPARLLGDDDAFARLGDAISQTHYLAPTPDLILLQRRGVRALLGVAGRAPLGRILLALLSGFSEAVSTLGEDVRDAAMAAAAAALAPGAPAWLALQAATMLQPLAEADDNLAAQIARKLIAQRPKAAREVAFSLGHGGRGLASLAVLRELTTWPEQSVAAPAREAVVRRVTGGE